LFEEARELARDTKGWLRSEEGEALFALASRCRPPGVIVEIGSYMGKSTTWLAKGSRSGSGLKVCAVDPHGENTFEGFARNMKRARVEDLVVPYVMTSAKAAREIHESVALAFVDGSHTYDGVKSDVELWFPKVVEGGYMAFHDAVGNREAGEHRALRHAVYESGRFRNFRLVGSMVICQKARSSEVRRGLQTRWKLLMFDAADLPLEHYLPGPLLRRTRRILRRL